MPIVGLTDNIVPGWQEIGKLRKGKKRTGKGPGPDLTFFRFTSDRPQVEQAFYAAYPPQPKRINVVLPHDTADENFTAWMEEWGASMVLKHRCDGAHVVRRWNTKTEEYENFPEGEGPPCPYTTPPEEGGKFRTEKIPGCQITGRLAVVIPELVAAGYVGYVTVLTGAKHDVRSILATLIKTEEARRERGKTLAWLPFTLERVEQEISSPGWKDDDPGTRRKVKKSLVKLIPAEEWVRAQVEFTRREYMALPPPPEEVRTQATALLENGRQILHGDVEDAEWDEIEENDSTGDNGNDPAEQTDPATVQEETALRTKWEEYLAKQWAEAQALDLEIPPLPDDGNAMIEEIKQAAQELAERVQHAKLLKRWRELWDKAKVLRIDVEGITDDAPNDEIERKGKELAAQIKEAEAQIPVEQEALL